MLCYLLSISKISTVSASSQHRYSQQQPSSFCIPQLCALCAGLIIANSFGRWMMYDIRDAVMSNFISSASSPKSLVQKRLAFGTVDSTVQTEKKLPCNLQIFVPDCLHCLTYDFSSLVLRASFWYASVILAWHVFEWGCVYQNSDLIFSGQADCTIYECNPDHLVYEDSILSIFIRNDWNRQWCL